MQKILIRLKTNFINITKQEKLNKDQFLPKQFRKELTFIN